MRENRLGSFGRAGRSTLARASTERIEPVGPFRKNRRHTCDLGGQKKANYMEREKPEERKHKAPQEGPP